MRHVPTALYIDTEIFSHSNLRFDSNDFKELRDTFVKGGLRLLVPAMMERELVRHFQRRAKEVAKNLTSAHRKHPIEALDLWSPPPEQELEKQCYEKLYKNWEIFKEHFTVEPLPLTGRMEDIANWYFGVEAPFSEKKPKEFPDAFIISVLEEYHRDHSVRIAVISADGDFANACARRRYLSHFRKIKDYIETFKPELTKTDDGEIIDPTKPITAEDLAEMKAILGRGEKATEIERNRVLNLLSTRGSNYDYFFRNADKAFWIDSLLSNDHFNNPPAAERFDDGRIQMPIWWPIEYLVRIFEQAPKKVIKVLDSLPRTDNVWILEGILKIVLKSDDLKLIQKFYDSIEAYLDSARWGDEKIIELLAKPYLFQGQLADISSALLLKIVAFQPDPMAEEKAKRRKEDAGDWMTILEPSPRCDAWAYQQILKCGVQPLSRREPVAVARILIDATSSMIRLRMHRDQLDKRGDEDISEGWCRRLDQPEDIEGPEAMLVHALADACNAVYKDAPESIDMLDQTLRNQRWKVFKRLRQLLYARYPSDRTLPWIREFILAHEDFDKWDHHHEFQMMIRKACEHFDNRLLTEEERCDIFNKILSGPSQERFRERMGKRYTDIEWIQRKHYFHRKQLQPFITVLFGEYRTYFDEIEAEFADDKLTDESYSPFGEMQSGSVSYRSPYSTEDLKQLSDEELLDCINKWQKSEHDSYDFLVEINIGALAGTFQSLFKDVIVHDVDRLAFWLDNRKRIERPVYVKAMVAAMQAITKERLFDHLGQWLSFCDWILERPNDICTEEDRGNDESRETPDWRSCRCAVGDFVGVCLEKDVQVPLIVRDVLADLLRKLCNQFDYRLEHDRPILLNQNDQLTEAINNTRSRALETLVNFGYWVHRHNEDDDVPELPEILETRFADDATCPLTLPEHAILGLQFFRIWNLNNDWAKKNKEHFFPRNDLKIWVEAFRTFILFNRPFRRIFELLKDDFIVAINKLKDFEGTNDSALNPTKNIGQHLFTYYLWGVYPLQGDDSLLNTFYDKTTNDRHHWYQLFDYVGRILRNSSKLDKEIHDRILDFFEWRLEQAERVELQAFAFWLEADCLDPNWRLEAYSKILDITKPKNVYLDINALNELLEDHTAKVIECFAKITDSFSRENAPHLQTDKIKPILLAGLQSTDETVRSDAERARETLLKAGYFDLVDVGE